MNLHRARIEQALDCHLCPPAPSASAGILGGVV